MRLGIVSSDLGVLAGGGVSVESCPAGEQQVAAAFEPAALLGEFFVDVDQGATLAGSWPGWLPRWVIMSQWWADAERRSG